MKQLLLASAALLGLTTGANATLTLSESVNGGGFADVCTGNPACSPGFTFTDSAGVNFLVLGASSNSPGTPTSGDVTQASVRVTNTSATTQSFSLRVSDTDFLAPSGPVTLFNNISGTVIQGSPVNLFASFACADASNVIGACANQTSPIVSDITGSNTVGANSNSLAIALLGAPFSLTELIDVTLGAGSIINFSVSADVVPAVEPGSLALLGVGMLGLGMIRARKRT